MTLDLLEQEWRDFRRGLRLRELPALDRLWGYVRAHEHLLPAEPSMDHAMMLMLQGQEAELADLRARLVRAAGAHAEDGHL